MFQDIDNVTWAQNSIINAYQMQVVDGVSEDRFDPGSSVIWAHTFSCCLFLPFEIFMSIGRVSLKLSFPLLRILHGKFYFLIRRNRRLDVWNGSKRCFPISR
nr:S-layer homology domain-containing protein [Paenibacillus tyrfis]